MNITKTLLAVLICIVIVAPASAQNPSSGDPQAAVVEKAPLDLDPLIGAIDKNKDGCMTETEWKAVGMPMSTFNHFVKDGCVTKKIMLDDGGPNGIDLNGNGKLTLEEVLEYEKRSESGGEGGAQQGATVQGSPAEK